MDTDKPAVFLPLSPEELTGNLGLRIVQYCNLVDDVARLAVQHGLAGGERQTIVAGHGYYMRYITMHGFGCSMSFHAHRWADHNGTPLWLTVRDPGWKTVTMAKTKLASLTTAAEEGGCVVPLPIPTGTERETVINSLLGRLREVYMLLTASAPGDGNQR